MNTCAHAARSKVQWSEQRPCTAFSSETCAVNTSLLRGLAEAVTLGQEVLAALASDELIANLRYLRATLWRDKLFVHANDVGPHYKGPETRVAGQRGCPVARGRGFAKHDQNGLFKLRNPNRNVKLQRLTKTQCISRSSVSKLSGDNVETYWRINLYINTRIPPLLPKTDELAVQHDEASPVLQRAANFADSSRSETH
ncbi:hypothetical protein ACJJTC_010838 [Scirpophaga incertulas]